MRTCVFDGRGGKFQSPRTGRKGDTASNGDKFHCQCTLRNARDACHVCKRYLLHKARNHSVACDERTCSHRRRAGSISFVGRADRIAVGSSARSFVSRSHGGTSNAPRRNGGRAPLPRDTVDSLVATGCVVSRVATHRIRRTFPPDGNGDIRERRSRSGTSTAGARACRTQCHRSRGIAPESGRAQRTARRVRAVATATRMIESNVAARRSPSFFVLKGQAQPTMRKGNRDAAISWALGGASQNGARNQGRAGDARCHSAC